MNRKMPVYYECSMTKLQHILAYVAFSILLSIVAYLFYHLVFISLIVGFAAGIYAEKVYAASTVEKRLKILRLQFKDFLASMSVAVRAGNVEIQAVRSALEDLKLSYNEKADIVKEVENIITQYDGGGIELKVLFEDLASRSNLEDIRSFATIYGVIEGKSDRFGDILEQTNSIIADKIEIEQEIETTITSAKSETNTMIIMPIIIVVAMSVMGSGLTSKLFEEPVGHAAATIALIIFGLSYALAVKSSKIDV